MALLTNINGKFSVSDAGAVTFNNAFTFPTADGTANYVLKTNGSGQLAWAADNYENYDYWILQGDSAANVNINSTNTLKFVGGTYIDTSATWAGGSNARKLTINHETTSRTDTTSTDAPAFGGTFEAVTSVSTNSTGHVTAIDVSTITIPTDPGGTVKGTGTATRVAFWSASDTITSDADLYWDNTNKRLGIGTTSPDYKLEVESTSDADLVSIKSTAIANNTQMRLGISGNDSVISGTGGSTGNLVFKTYGAERMRINSFGQTWLGGTFTGTNITTSNTAYLNNLNAGGFSILHRNAADVYIHFNSYYNSSNVYEAKYGGAQGFRIDSGAVANGLGFYKAPVVNTAGDTQTFSHVMQIGYGANNNVGIGVTDPDSKLDVNAGITAITAGPAMRISKGASPVGLIRYDTLVIEGNDVPTIRFGESDGTVSTIASGDSNLRINTTGDIKFYTSGTATGEGHGGQGGTFAMAIATDQNVGIGTSSPSFQLSIENHATTSSIATFEIDGKRTNGTDGAVGEMIFSNNGDTFATVAGARDGADNSGSLLFQTQDSGTFGTRMRIDASGQIVFPRTGQPPITNSLYGNIVLDSNAVTNFQRIRYDVGTTPYWGLTRLNTGNFAVTGGSTWNDHVIEFQYATGNVQINETVGQRRLNVYDATDAWIRLYCGSVADWIFGSNGSDHAFKWYNQSSNGGAGYKMQIETSGTLTVSADVVAYGSPSDIRLKENIKPIESALDKVSKLQGVTFDWKESDSILNIKEDIGFIAQDVQKIIPELVRENEDGMLSMRHQGIAPILLEAIKELKAEIEELKFNKCNCK